MSNFKSTLTATSLIWAVMIKVFIPYVLSGLSMLQTLTAQYFMKLKMALKAT